MCRYYEKVKFPIFVGLSLQKQKNMSSILSKETLIEYYNEAVAFVVEYAPRVIVAFIVLFVGLRLTRLLEKWVLKALGRMNVDEALKPFLTGIVVNIAKIAVILFAAGIVGFRTSSLFAVVATAGFAVGMALQGSLANFASGVLILLFKPYKIGDLVEINDQVGHVEEIQIFNTILTTLDNKQVIIPNSMPLGDHITNFTEKEYIRVDLNVSMPYEEDFEKVEKILLDKISGIDKVLTEPATYVGIEEFDTHNIKLAVRPHCKPEDYWDVYFEVNKKIKNALGEAGIKMAYSEGVELGNIGR